MRFITSMAASPSNGGVRCEPLTDDSLGRRVRELRYPTPDSAAIQIAQDASGPAGVVLVCSAGAPTIQSPLPVTPTAADALDSLIARNVLFEDVDGDS